MTDATTFIQAAGGAAGAATVDWGMEHIWRTNPSVKENNLLFAETSKFTPPVDDFVPLVVSAAVLGVGQWVGSDTMTNIGAGGVVYSSGMLIKNTLTRSITNQVNA